MQEIVKLEALFRSCEGSQQVANLLQKIKKVASEFEGKTGHPSINFQVPEKIKYSGRRKGGARPKYLLKDFGQANWRKISVSSGHAGLKAMVRLRARARDRKSAATQKTKNNKKQNKSKKEPLDLIDATKNKIKQIKKEPLDPVDATKNKTKKIKQEPLDPEIGFKRPTTAQEDYQYDYRTSVGKRVKFQPGFPVSYEIVNDVKGGFNLTADGWCGFRVLAYLIYKDQEKFPLVKRDMLATLPKYSSIYASTFGTDVKQLEAIIKHGSDLCITNSNSDSNSNTNTNFIPACLDASMWFSTSDCAQLAADTYKRPVCVYSDNPNTPSVSFLPFTLPENISKHQQPLIFNHVNNNHWTTVHLSHNVSRKWLTIPELFFLGCVRNQIPDNFDTYWNKFKEFNKYDHRNAMFFFFPIKRNMLISL
ncbi:hypothetical protein PHYBLDRAFT_173439 [Phycomyces blakesleeanus NRRL 1555(-)]|uniref:OTU domain-containing protein n=1 Tax=Phycomyces blakesleeanus (strain ATCC 8743b / DSM 1359 / FGSC 10004 / NBRC 33097 / NRRL 1555) TaxID=763407 RepID=A0A162TMX1_PHYB8|nr:hypothetical protein PHYBLDRAFT_173439 [Phycomyces blakesleeanus NRRL 1555(-)]OAD68443.1 hypothetical protein PHYBLDRAFT_173439 [Phycomyces blakesleeanus NRRL 1555(-)]|eukprot:XP_018286483.1 hypothetical protein PHYBLDRAFT_173439 [Phycomyces blakesleeanus NRRL 1555(-)]